MDAVTDVRRFEQGCAYCGARYRVTVPPQAVQEQVRSYHCPECNKETQIRASLPALVQLLAPRTDGRADPYQETFF